MSGIDYVARGMMRALDIVESAADGTADVDAAGREVVDIMLDPMAACMVGPLIGMLTRACMQMCEETGRTPADVVAGWRRCAAEDLDNADRLTGGAS